MSTGIDPPGSPAAGGPSPTGGEGPKAASANPPVDPDPHPKSFGIEVPGAGTRDNGPKAAIEGPPPIIIED